MYLLVQVDRLKLPQEAATVQLEDYLVDEDIRDGYLRPSTLTLADSEPFVGRACNRVRRAEFPKFIRALDERGMLAAVRRAFLWVPTLGSSVSERAGTKAAACGFCVW